MVLIEKPPTMQQKLRPDVATDASRRSYRYVRTQFFEKIFGIFHFNYYLCSAVPVRPSPRLFDAGDDPGVLILLFISLILNHFSIIPCIFQKKSVSLQKISGARQSESKLSLHSLA